MSLKDLQIEVTSALWCLPESEVIIKLIKELKFEMAYNSGFIKETFKEQD